MSEVQKIKKMDDNDLKRFIAKHLNYAESAEQKRIEYTFGEVESVISGAMAVFREEEALVEMRPPVVVVGDIHGQFTDLLRIFTLNQKRDGNGTWVNGALCAKHMFLGDYVDRGYRSLECVCLLFGLKTLYPKKFVLLRGNHETFTINKIYGFYDELQQRFTPEEGESLWISFNQAFAWMPLAGLIGKKILGMHGGLSPSLSSLDDIRKIERPLHDLDTNRLAMDLLWSDPKSQQGYSTNTLRGVSCFFGEDIVTDTLKKLKLDLIVRAHQVQQNGYGFFGGRQLVTIFSAPRYQIDLNNKASVMMVAGNGTIHFKKLFTDEANTDGVVVKTDRTARTTSEKSFGSRKVAAQPGNSGRKGASR